MYIALLIPYNSLCKVMYCILLDFCILFQSQLIFTYLFCNLVINSGVFVNLEEILRKFHFSLYFIIFLPTKFLLFVFFSAYGAKPLYLLYWESTTIKLRRKTLPYLFPLEDTCLNTSPLFHPLSVTTTQEFFHPTLMANSFKFKL